MLATSAAQHSDAVRHLAPSVAAALRTALLDFVCVGDCAHPQSEAEWAQQMKLARELEAELQQRETKRVERAAKRAERKKKATLHVQSTSGHFSCQCGMGGPSPQTGPTYCVKCRLCLTCCGHTPRCSAASALVVSDDDDEDESVDDKAKAASATGGDEALSAVPSSVRIATDLLLRLAPFSGAAVAEIASRFATAVSTAHAPASASSTSVASASAGSLAVPASRLVDTRPNLLRIVDLLSADSEGDSKSNAADSQLNAVETVARSLADTVAAQLLDSSSQVAAKLDAATEMDAAFRALVAAVAHQTLALRISSADSESDASVGAETALLVALNRVLAPIRDPNADVAHLSAVAPTFEFSPTTVSSGDSSLGTAMGLGASASASATTLTSESIPSATVVVSPTFRFKLNRTNVPDAGLRVRRGPSVHSEHIGTLADFEQTYEFARVEGDWAKIMPIHGGKALAKSYGYIAHDAAIDGWCAVRLNGKTLLNEARPATNSTSKASKLKFGAAALVDAAPPPPPTIGSLAAVATADHALLSCVRRLCARAIAATVAHCVRMIDVLRQSAVTHTSGTHKRFNHKYVQTRFCIFF